MKTKFAFLCLLFFAVHLTVFSQGSSFDCEFKPIKTSVNDVTKLTKLIKPTKPVKPATTNPCGDDEIAYLRVNVHFMQRIHTSTLDARNFTATDDGNGNTGVTGYSYAGKLVDRMNDYMRRNVQVALWPGSPQTTPPDIVPGQILLNHTGTYFHAVPDNEYYTLINGGSFNQIVNQYGVNLGTDINLFMMERDTSCATGGAAFAWQGKYSAYLYNGWKIYTNDDTDDCEDCTDCDLQGCGTCGDGTTAMAKVGRHEIGHLLQLQHPFCGFNGCADIDQAQETEGPITDPSACQGVCGCAAGGCDPCWTSGSNNAMAYVNTAVALTPCQVERTLVELDVVSDYISHCCDEWTFLPTNSVEGLPAKKMIVECEEPLCNDFDIIGPDCAGFGAGVWPHACFEITNLENPSSCNDWDVKFFDENTGLLVHEYDADDVSDVIFPFPVGHDPYAMNILVCVELCDEDCEMEKCEYFIDPWNFGNTEADDRNKMEEGDKKELALSILPNPSDGEFQISWSEKIDSGVISIFNTHGQLIRNYDLSKNANANLAINDLSKGLYFVKLQSLGKEVVQKLIIQ